MEANFARDLRLLTNALRHPTFRFIVIGHNRKSIITDVKAHIQATYPDRPYHELRLSGKTYREFIDGLKGFQEGIVVIPDFDWLFQPGNESICTGFNQRRDALAKLPIALLCFVEPSGYRNLPKRLPDWWSLRSLELEFQRETTDERIELLSLEREMSSLGGQTKEEKEAEIRRLLEQLEGVEPENKGLLFIIQDQIATLFYELSDYKKAKYYWESSLMITRIIGDTRSETVVLNSLGEIYLHQGDYSQASAYFNLSLTISQQTNDQPNKVKALKNTGRIYYAQKAYDEALTYFEESLHLAHAVGDIREQGKILNSIGRVFNSKKNYIKALDYYNKSIRIFYMIGDKIGEERILNNIGGIYIAQGNYNQAIACYEKSLLLTRQTGDKLGEGFALNNLGLTYFKNFRDINKAFPLLLAAHVLLEQVGSPYATATKGYLDDIRQQIGEERYNQLIQSLPEIEEL